MAKPRRTRTVPARCGTPSNHAPGGFLTGVRLLLPAALLIAGAAIAEEENSAPNARELVQQGTILPLDQVIRRARSLRPGRIIDARLLHEPGHGGYVYEVEVVGEDGVVWELELVAGSGELINKKPDGD
jgi:uncharacterized membrane protein YkoI